MQSTNTTQGELLPLIDHQIDNKLIGQRAHDGYVNATALCKASGKAFAHYTTIKGTQEFLSELSADIGIPISELIQSVKGGIPSLQGTWVHPQVAIHLGQWCSPKFAVLVSKWIFEWMSGGVPNQHQMPYHIRRYLVNRHKIPPTHFSMLDQMTMKLLGALEVKGYMIPANLMPDISLGRMFSKWLRDNGHDPETFPSYEHVFDDGVRQPVAARLYPNEMMTSFNLQLDNWIRDGRALKYFSDRDQKSIAALTQVYAELPAP